MISIVIPTKNSQATIGACLDSIRSQDYHDYEIIIVDGNSTDSTVDIAKRFTDKILVLRSSVPAARNAGFGRAVGETFLSVDSDMLLSDGLLMDVSEKIAASPVLVIPEDGHGGNFISRCKKLEKRLYLGEAAIESARAFTRKAFSEVDGYNPSLHFAEDRDLHLRLGKTFRIGRTEAKLLHSSDHLSLLSLLEKSYAYGHSLPRYLAASGSGDFSSARKAFIRNWIRHLPDRPFLATALLLIKALEYMAGLAGFLAAKMGK